MIPNDSRSSGIAETGPMDAGFATRETMPSNGTRDFDPSGHVGIDFGLHAVLGYLLHAQGIRFLESDWHEENLTEVNGEEMVACESISLARAAAIAQRYPAQVERFMLPLTEAALRAGPLAPLATPLPCGKKWIILLGKSWSQYVVATGSGKVQLTGEDLMKALGQVQLDEPRAWLSVHNPVLSSDSAHSHGSASHGGHEHHGEKPHWRLWRMLRLESQDVGVITIFAAAISLLSLATPLAVESLVNTIAYGRLLQPIVVISLMLLVILGFAAVLRALQFWVAEVMQRRFFVRVASDLAWRLPRLREETHDHEHLPEVLNRFFDVMTVQKAASSLVLDGVSIVLQVTIGMAILAFYHPYLLGLDLVLLFTMTGVVWQLGRGAVKTAINESRAKYRVAAFLEEVAHAPHVFRKQANADWFCCRVDELASEYLAARKSHFHIVMRQNCFALGLQALAGSVLFGIGGYLVISGQLTLGQLVAAELIVAVIVGSFAKLGKHMESFYDLQAAVDKIGHLVDLPVEQAGGGSLPATTAPAKVTVHDASYCYGEHEAALAPVTFHVSPGEIMAITGAAGAGKSTLLDLLYGLRAPSSGYICIDDINLRDCRLAEFRSSAALVRATETVSGTIWENVVLGRGDKTLIAVTNLLQDLGLMDQLRELPLGLRTPIHGSGAPLTRQQLVLLALARAISDGPRLLLIDGVLDGLAASVIDRVLKVLDSLRRTTTVIIVTNRPEILQRCDRRLVLSHHSLSLAGAVATTAAGMI